jgi:cephalosporin hydroxylase
MELSTGPFFSREFHRSEIWKKQITWRGVTCWKCPLDLWSYQQIIVASRPEAVIECGVASGGTTLYLADLLDILGQGGVFGIDKNLQLIDPRATQHPRVEVIEGSTTDLGTASLVAYRVRGLRTMVILDSAQETEHVLAELRTYADLVTRGCYLVCEDAVLDRPDLPSVGAYAGPFGAIQQFLAERTDFIQHDECVLGASFNPNGYLLRTS